MNIYAKTQRGKGKSQSDDRIIIDGKVLCESKIILTDVSPRIIGIADGVGGNKGGNLAAQFVCEHIDGIIPEGIECQLHTLNCKLLNYAENINDCSQMATTFSGIFFFDSSTVMHVGNTRIYTSQGSYLKQVTSDHTTANWLLKHGLSDESDSCNKSEISACFGGGLPKLFTPDIFEYSFGNAILITSDGIHDFVDIDTIEDILFGGEDISLKADRLIAAAMENGSCDDISILYCF